MKWNGNDLLLAGADQVLDGVHFDSAVHSPRAIGIKAMNRNLSDCAAMACLPAAALATVALPKGASIDYAKELFLGLQEAGDKFNCPIIGGDTSSWNGKLALSVSILGQSAVGPPICRNGARSGDLIGVTGPLGGSILGRHMTFAPRVREARAIAECFEVHAMIDLSDGLSRDLQHICSASNCGAIVNAAALPIHDDAIEMRRDGRSPLEHALHDGEDYELLVVGTFRQPPDRTAVTPEKTLIINSPNGVEVDLTFVGVMKPEPGVLLQRPDGRREPLEPMAWEHRF
jgi:thiamine-monophosphate kinase